MDPNELPKELEVPWYWQGACTQSDPELWFPESYRGGMPRGQVAKDICFNRCTVRLDCLAGAMVEEEKAGGKRYGIRGGLDAKERGQLKKRLVAYNRLKESL